MEQATENAKGYNKYIIWTERTFKKAQKASKRHNLDIEKEKVASANRELRRMKEVRKLAIEQLKKARTSKPAQYENMTYSEFVQKAIAEAEEDGCTWEFEVQA